MSYMQVIFLGVLWFLCWFFRPFVMTTWSYRKEIYELVKRNFRRR